MEKIANLSVTEAKALRMLERKRGVELPILCDKLSLEERQARSLIDRLRRKGVPVERTGKATFHAEHLAAQASKGAAPKKRQRKNVWDGTERRQANRRTDQLSAS